VLARDSYNWGRMDSLTGADIMTRSFRKLPVVDTDRRVIGQVSRRDILVAIEAGRDNPRLYGVEDLRPAEASNAGDDSVMRTARGRH